MPPKRRVQSKQRANNEPTTMTGVNKTVPSLGMKRRAAATVIQARMRGYFVRRWKGAVPTKNDELHDRIYYKTQHITELEEHLRLKKDLEATIWRLRQGLERAKEHLSGHAKREALYLFLDTGNEVEQAEAKRVYAQIAISSYYLY
tara:strand:- start:356 stop:793 length:438 start_codon:yes stop_codon:yes gene_type:complete